MVCDIYERRQGMNKTTKSINLDELKGLVIPEKVCRNCELWDRRNKERFGNCRLFGRFVLPDEDFGCNQWEAK